MASNADGTTAASELALGISDDEGFEIVLAAHASAPEESDQRPMYTWSDEVPTQTAANAANDDLDASDPLPSKPRQLAGMLQIQLAARNPLPPLCRAIQKSHFRHEHDAFERTLSPGFWINSPLNAAAMPDAVDGALYGVPTAPPTPVDLKSRNREGLMVAKLPAPVQRAFRQSVLRTILFARCGIVAGVCACIALLPFDVWRQQQNASQSWLLHVLLSTCAVLYVLTLGLLYSVRHDFPINGAVLAFLLGIEVCCALLWCLLGNLNAIVAGSVLYMATMAGVHLFATWRRATPQTPRDGFELLHPLNAAKVSVAVVISIGSTVYFSSVLPAMSRASIPPWAFVGVLACITVAGLWTGLTLHCMSASMAPDEYARCLVFYHSDVFVACCVVPYRWSLKCWRAVTIALRRRAATGPAQAQAQAELTESPSESTTAPVDDANGGGDDDIGDLESQLIPQGLPTSPTRRRSSVVVVVV